MKCYKTVSEFTSLEIFSYIPYMHVR